MSDLIAVLGTGPNKPSSDLVLRYVSDDAVLLTIGQGANRAEIQVGVAALREKLDRLFPAPARGSVGEAPELVQPAGKEPNGLPLSPMDRIVRAQKGLIAADLPLVEPVAETLGLISTPGGDGLDPLFQTHNDSSSVEDSARLVSGRSSADTVEADSDGAGYSSPTSSGSHLPELDSNTEPAGLRGDA